MAFDITEDIKTLLVGIAPDIFRHELPDNPDNVLGVFTNTGSNPTHTMGGNSNQAPAFENPIFQVVSRHNESATAMDWILGVKNALDGLTDTTINGNLYISIIQSGDILPLGRDPNRRIAFSLNFTAQVTRG